jgi:hypothetical protein
MISLTRGLHCAHPLMIRARPPSAAIGRLPALTHLDRVFALRVDLHYPASPLSGHQVLTQQSTPTIFQLSPCPVNPKHGMHPVSMSTVISPEGAADENLDYLEVVHVLVRTPHASGPAIFEVG